jgi:hypothetical protein
VRDGDHPAVAAVAALLDERAEGRGLTAAGLVPACARCGAAASYVDEVEHAPACPATRARAAWVAALPADVASQVARDPRLGALLRGR